MRLKLQDLARRRGYPDDAARLDLLGAYGRALEAIGQRLNLSAARTPDAIFDAVIASALAVVHAVEAPPCLVADLGTGNGMPGVAAAVAWPDASVLLIERRGRKAQAVGDILDEAGIGNAQVLHADGREVLGLRPTLKGRVDLVTIRAVGKLDATTQVVRDWVAPGGSVAHWKGAALSPAELRDGERAAAAAGLDVLPIQHFDDEAGPRHLVVYRRPTQGGRGHA